MQRRYKRRQDLDIIEDTLVLGLTAKLISSIYLEF